MKKWLLCLTALLCLLLVPALGEGETEAVVANPQVADRLNLRAQADSDSETLGRFYSGTPVTLLSETGEWAKVRIGDLEGYMLREYLMEKNRNYGAPELFYTAAIKDNRAVLREAPKNTAAEKAVLWGEVYVLGDIGDDWRYVMQDGQYGYVRTAQLIALNAEIPLAYLMPENGDAVAVYGETDLKKQIATYYPGTRVRVTNASRAGGWALIEGSGTIWTNMFQGEAITGYVRLEDLLVFAHYWQVEERFRTGEALSDISFLDEISQSIVKIARGTRVTVIGETDDRYQLLWRDGVGIDIMGFVRKTQLHLSGTADRNGPKTIAYAQVRIVPGQDGWNRYPAMYLAPNGETEGEVYNPLAQVVAVRDGWYQLRARDLWFFLPEADVAQTIAVDALYPQVSARHAPGEWDVTQAEAGLQLLTVPQGETAALTVLRSNQEGEITYALDAGEYTFYLPEGTRARLTGAGEMVGAAAGTLPVLLEKHPEQIAMEKHALYEGSGRFYFEDQLPDDWSWYSYRIEPIPGAEDSWYKFSSLFEEGEAYPVTQEMVEDSTVDVTGAPGMFLEIHNCILTVTYGNG